MSPHARRLLRLVVILVLGSVPTRAFPATSARVGADRGPLQTVAVTTVERRIAVGSDDAEESASGSMYLDSSDLELVFDTDLQTVGLRFAAVSIPWNAEITRAYIQFEADEQQSEATNLLVQGEASDHPAAFSQTSRVSTRPRTLAGVSWTPAAWTLVGEVGASQRTPELSGVIQELVNRPGWANGNEMVFILTGTGHRTARSYEGKAAGAALLHVEFTGGGPQTNRAPVVDAGPNPTTTLPADAALDGTVSDDGLPDPPAMLTTNWSLVSGPGAVTFQNASAVDTRASFTAAGTYLLRLTASDGALSASDSVMVTVQPASVPTVERRITVGSDDAEESASGTMYLTSSDLELVYDGNLQKVGLRYTNVTIPPGVTITRAYLQFEAIELQSEATNLLIQGEAADRPLNFSLTSKISTRARTLTGVAWTPAAWTLVGEAGANQRTPDLAGVVQELVNRPGWASGNEMAFIVTGTGHRTARSFEGKATAAALLHVEFSSSGPLPNQAPEVDAGPNPITTLPGDAALDGTVSDDGLPGPPAMLTTNWSLVSGPGAVTFQNASAIDTRASFTVAGTYLLRLTASDGALSASDSVRVTVQPGPAVDEIHWTITGPTAITFDWRGAGNALRYGPTPALGQTVTPSAPSPSPYSSAGPFWEARLTGLQPNTLYYYSIGTEPVHTFRTPPARGTSGFTLAAEGDIGDSGSYPEVAGVQSLIAGANPAFVLALGDLTYGNSNGLPVVDRHFNDVMVWSRDAAYMPVWGNHEWESPELEDLRDYKGRFELPNPQTSPSSPTVSCCGEDWYWFDHGNVRFIAYPEPWTTATWPDWNTQARALMDQAQADPAIRLIVTFGHQPAYSSGIHPGDPALQVILDALGDAHSKYVLNLNGHSHDYERSKPQHGVVHVTIGTGGASLEPDSTCLWLQCTQPAWSAFRAMHLGPLVLHFTDEAISGQFLCGPAGGGPNDVNCALGSVVDQFVIGASGPGPNIVERRIATGTDDAEESANGNLSHDSSDLELVYDGGIQKVGLRYTTVSIPPGATITRAYLQFEADEQQSEATNLLVQGEAADHPVTFSQANRVSPRPRTLAGANWAPASWTLVGEAGANQRTPDLAGVVQELVNRPGWASGNEMAFIISGTGHRTARSYEGRAAGAALLHVEFASGAAHVGESAPAPAVDAPRLELALHGVSPNPSRGTLNVEFSLPDAQPALLEVLDVSGRRVTSREVGSLGPGRHQLDLRGGLRPGVYLVRLAQGSRARVTKAVVTP